jgi:hypothetical protein
MVFVAPQGVQFPVDAVWVKPALVKQLERKQVSSSFFYLVWLVLGLLISHMPTVEAQVEKQRQKDELELIKTEEQIREIKVAADLRDALERLDTLTQRPIVRHRRFLALPNETTAVRFRPRKSFRSLTSWCAHTSTGERCWKQN